MRTLIIGLLIPIGIIADVLLSVCSLSFYILNKSDNNKKLITEQLIDKL